MPRFDGTGPVGNGKLTGRGMGKCEPKNDLNNQAQRRGLGRGRGRGMGFSSLNKEDLLNEKEVLQARINQIDKTLE